MEEVKKEIEVDREAIKEDVLWELEASMGNKDFDADHITDNVVIPYAIKKIEEESKKALTVKKEVVIDPRRESKDFEAYRWVIDKVIDEKNVIRFVSTKGDVDIMTPEVYKEKLLQERKKTLEEVQTKMNRVLFEYSEGKDTIVDLDMSIQFKKLANLVLSKLKEEK